MVLRQPEAGSQNLMAAAEELLSWRRDGVLGSLGHAELDHGLGFDLDGLASLGIAPHPCLPLCLHQPAEPGDDKHAILLRLLHCRLCQQIEKRCGLLVGQLKFFCHCPDQCCLGHACCHSVSFFRLVCSWAHGRVFCTLEDPCRKRFSCIRGPLKTRLDPHEAQCLCG